MSLINQYNPNNPFYKDAIFVGYSLTGLIVVMQSATPYGYNADSYKGITNDTIVKDYGNKRPITLAFNPVYMYTGFVLLALMAMYIKSTKK